MSVEIHSIERSTIEYQQSPNSHGRHLLRLSVIQARKRSEFRYHNYTAKLCPGSPILNGKYLARHFQGEVRGHVNQNVDDITVNNVITVIEGRAIRGR
jgi:hypothetical protein